MVVTKLIFLLILFIVRSRPDCIKQSDNDFTRCIGHSFDSFKNIGENSKAISIENPPEAPFFMDKSNNTYLNTTKALDFSRTETLVISEYGFKDFVSLSSLNLQRSSITTLKSTWFLANNSIFTIDCSNNKLRKLFKSDFENLKKLKDVDFSRNLLESIEPHTFSELKDLLQLKLTGNQLKSIPTGHLPMLLEIQLDHNLIEMVPANVLTEMPNLRYIYLRNNAIRKIEDGAFRDLKLNRLHLSNNFIEEVTEFTFSGLTDTTLTWLDLSSNKIKRIATAFKEMQVQHLNFSNNSITELNEDSFEGLDVKVLTFEFNQIEIIGNNTFRGLGNLKSLCLNNNKLLSLNADIFGTSLQNLLELQVRNNSISQLDPNLFKFTSNIESFSISLNKLQSLPEDIFVPLKGLRTLFIQDNMIEELTESQIESLKFLKFLSIEHNQLTFIPLSEDSFPNLETVRIGGNPWQCACLDEVQNLLNIKGIEFIKWCYFDGQCPACVPTYLQHCEKNINFARRARIPETYESSNTEQCRIKYLRNSRTEEFGIHLDKLMSFSIIS